MWSLFKFTVTLSLLSSAFISCYGTSDGNFKDFNGMNNNISIFGAKKYNMMYFDMGPGLERLYFRTCPGNVVCEEKESCRYLDYPDEKPPVCIRMCTRDSECENNPCDRHWGCLWTPCFGFSDCKSPFVCAKTSHAARGYCVRICDCGDKGTCRFEKFQKKCDCNPGYVEDDGKCKECDCGNKGTCRFEKCQKICDCNPGFIEKDGKCIECNCGIKGSCRFEKSQKMCQCDPGFADDNGICRVCNCGRHGACRYESGLKKCDCEQGFSEADGTCLECDCGADSGCSFEGKNYKGLNKKVCHCKPLYKEENGTCVACICRGGKCVKEGGKVICKCPPGFGNFTKDSCRACDCGPDTNCMWEARFGGNKICLCKPGHSTKKGKCVACECGPDSNCEWISEGWLKPEKKVCHCKPGYHEEKGKCVDKQDRKSLQVSIPYSLFH